MAIILIIKENNKKHEVALNEHNFVIGRSRKADLKLDDPKISGEHCSFKVVADQTFVKDLNSTNGTFINKKKIKQAPFLLEDYIKIGKITIYLSKNKMNTSERNDHIQKKQDDPNSKLIRFNKKRDDAKIKKAKEVKVKKKKIEKQPENKFAVLTRILKIK